MSVSCNNKLTITEKSHTSGKIYSTSERLCEVQIKVPKSVLTYVLAQCLNNLQLENQGVAHA